MKRINRFNHKQRFSLAAAYVSNVTTIYIYIQLEKSPTEMTSKKAFIVRPKLRRKEKHIHRTDSHKPVCWYKNEPDHCNVNCY